MQVEYHVRCYSVYWGWYSLFYSFGKYKTLDNVDIITYIFQCVSSDQIIKELPRYIQFCIITNPWVRTRYVTWNTATCTLASKAVFTKDSENPKSFALILYGTQITFERLFCFRTKHFWSNVKTGHQYKVWAEGS